MTADSVGFLPWFHCIGSMAPTPAQFAKAPCFGKVLHPADLGA